MNISLTPAMEKYINDKVSSGLYGSVSELVREAIRLLISKDTISPERIAMLRNDVEEGLNDSISYDGRTVMKELLERYE